MTQHLNREDQEEQFRGVFLLACASALSGSLVTLAIIILWFNVTLTCSPLRSECRHVAAPRSGPPERSANGRSPARRTKPRNRRGAEKSARSDWRLRRNAPSPRV